MKTPQQREQFLEELHNSKGNITVACAKAGIKSTATAYSWRHKSERFRKRMDAIIEEEFKEMCDFVENTLLNHIEKGNIASCIFWLKTRHPLFKQFIQIASSLEVSKKLTDTEKKLLINAVALATNQEVKQLENGTRRDKKIGEENPERPDIQEGAGQE